MVRYDPVDNIRGVLEAHVAGCGAGPVPARGSRPLSQTSVSGQAAVLAECLYKSPAADGVFAEGSNTGSCRRR